MCLTECSSDRSYWTWKHVNETLLRTLTNNTERSEYAISRDFPDLLRTAVDFRYCLSSHCFKDQVVTGCMGLLIKGLWFTFAHTEIGSGVSFALFNRGINFWCAFTSSTSKRVFQRCYHSLKAFYSFAARSMWTWGVLSTIYYSTSRRLENFPPSSRSSRFYFEYRFAKKLVKPGPTTTTTNQQLIVQWLHKYAFGVPRA